MARPGAEKSGRFRRVPRVLLAEDDFEMRRFLSGVLRTDGFEVIAAANRVQLMELVGLDPPSSGRLDLDLVISDIRMIGASGLEVLADLRTRSGAPPVILITAFGDPDMHAEAERLGVIAVLDKLCDVDALRALARRAVLVESGGAA
jgi:DNA-binding NtrC family response regulator